MSRWFRTRAWCRSAVALVVSGVTLSCASPTARPLAPLAGPAPLALQGVTVVDVRTGQLLPDQTVVIAGTRIHAVGPVARTRVPAGAQVVEARGKYLIPGLWDMHLHVADRVDLAYPLLIANGITGFREPGGGGDMSLDTQRRWRREVATGQRVGPRFLLTGPYLEVGSDGGALGPAAARRLLDSLQRAGAEFLKLHYIATGSERFTPDSFLAVLSAARRTGLPVAGHSPIQASQDSSGTIHVDTSTSAATLLAAVDSGMRTIGHLQHLRFPLNGSCMGATATARKCAALARRLRRNGTWVVPTLSLSYYRQGPPDTHDRPIIARLPYLPDSLRRHDGTVDDWSPGLDLDTILTPAVARMGQADMPLLAGTDVAAAFPPPWLVHEELALLVEKGLTPLAALQAATLNPARMLNATDSLGTVEPGKLADLVLLDANPLADIRHTTQVRAVVANGRYFDRPALDQLLAEVNRVVCLKDPRTWRPPHCR